MNSLVGNQRSLRTHASLTGSDREPGLNRAPGFSRDNWARVGERRPKADEKSGVGDSESPLQPTYSPLVALSDVRERVWNHLHCLLTLADCTAEVAR